MNPIVPLTAVQLPLSKPRRRTREVKVGDIGIGGNNPIRVQSMITAETMNTEAAVAQIIQLYEAGCEIVRITAPNLREAQNLGAIRNELRRRGYGHIPLVADVHHQGMDIALECTKHVDKVRINPGLFVFRKPDPNRVDYSPAEIQQELEAIEQAFLPVIKACKERGLAMRIGVNHGSLSERIKVMYGDSPVGMVESAMEYIRICEAHGFKNLVISLKASRVPIMLSANRLMVKRMDEEGVDYPLHLGVTEAGDGMYARIKSAIGIGALLTEGIGDTIRVSLAEDPVNEIEVCYDILQALGLRKTKVEYIACPSCGRTKFDLPTVLNQVREATKHLVGLDIAVMGCLHPESPVMTREGLRPIREVRAGDLVLTDRGDFQPVLQTETHEFTGELVELRCAGMPPVQFTPNHPVLALPKTEIDPLLRVPPACRGNQVAVPLAKRGEPAGGGSKGAMLPDSARWYAADALQPGMVTLYPIVQGEQAVERLPECPDVPVDEAFLTIAACYLAEGSLGGARGKAQNVFFTCSADEVALARRLCDALQAHGAPARTRTRRNTLEVLCHSTEWAERMQRLFGRRAENKRMPDWMLTLPRAQQAQLLRTLWQCDGYCGSVRGYPRAQYVTVSPTLAFQVHQMLLRLGVAAGLTRRTPRGKQPVYTVSVTGSDALRRFAAQLGYKLDIPDGRRRTDRLAVDAQYLYLPVRAVRRVPYAGVVYNLEVAKAHTYTGSLALTHNCIVNGPGEMADADYGYVGRGGGKIALYRKGQLVKNDIPAERGVDELIALLKADGVWRDPE
jgi:(E)-4-hydroxy-3-methylbut-2-enyl-diphosphate synthase